MAHMQLVVIKKNLFKETPSTICMKMALPPDVSALRDPEIRAMMRSRVPQIKKEGEKKARRGIWLYIISDVETPITPFRWVQIEESEFESLTKGFEEVETSKSEIEDLKDEIKDRDTQIETLKKQIEEMKTSMALKDAKMVEYEKFMAVYHEAQKAPIPVPAQ